jgi:hypothetical protein
MVSTLQFWMPKGMKSAVRIRKAHDGQESCSAIEGCRVSNQLSWSRTKASERRTATSTFENSTREL